MASSIDGHAALAETVVDNSIDGLAVIDGDGRYLLWNRAMVRFAGKTAEEVLGRNVFEVFPFLRGHGLDRAIERVLTGQTVTTEGVEHIDADGARRVYDRVYLPLRSATDEIIGVVAIVRDATERYAAQDALRKSEAKMRMASEAAGVGLWSWEPTTDVVSWEAPMGALFGLTPGSSPPGREAYLALIHPEDREQSAARIAAGTAAGHWEDEFRIVRPDGSVRWLMSKARMLRNEGRDIVLGAVVDVTERRGRDERQRAAQRLEAVGQLTAGIAHNFNNMLMGLLPNLELATRRAPAELTPLLRGAQESAQRAADVVRQLMTYAGRNRKDTHRVEPVGPLIDRTVAFCRTTFDRSITLEAGCDEHVLSSVDANQLEQALLNLLINARDAVTDPSVGSPQVTVETVVVDRGAHDLEGRPGEWFCIRVTDNGVGMDAATAQRAYEPFFTTKEIGKGTGLGLATTQGIVREHGGFVTSRSAPGKGSTFSVYLPRVRAAHPVDGGLQEPPASAPASFPSRAGATVLVVDDEEPVRHVLAAMLEEGGFDVRTASSGDAAVTLLGAPEVAGRVQLVLLDVSMPGMPASTLRSRLRELVPHASVVYLTGYPYEAGADPVLEKPLSGDRLLSTLGEILAGKASGPLPARLPSARHRSR